MEGRIGAARRAALVALLLALIAPGAARADVPGPITTRVDNLLSTGGGITRGLYVKQVGGSVIAAKNETFAFEPASSIKALIHLYAHVQMQAGNASADDDVTLYEGTSGSCPSGAAALGTEDLDTSLSKMMRVSDNPATFAQMVHWGVGSLNTFASSTLGLAQTSFFTIADPPGFNILGCVADNNSSVDGHTMSLTDLGILYEGVADGSVLSGTFRDSFYLLMSGREQHEQFGGDFTGVWQKLSAMVTTEKPASMPGSLVADFRDGMTANHKGGSYRRCSDDACAGFREWFSMAGSAVFPSCIGGSFSSRSYVWGVFIDDAAGSGPGTTPAAMALGAASAEPLREQLHDALAGWGACYPPDVFVTTVPAAPPAGQSGYYNAADLAANGGAVEVVVSASDDSGVTDLVCTDGGTPVAVGNQVGTTSRSGSFELSEDGTHAIECEATDGMNPSNTGASDDSENTATVLIDQTPPALDCQPAVFVLNGPGGQVSAIVTDAESGPAAASVSAPADVSSGGVQTVELSAEDEAGNSATASCAYIVAYEFGGFLSPLGATHKAGSTVPLRFALTDANGVAIPDAEAQALAAACGVRIFFSGGDPSPNCASYNAGSNRFQLNLKLPAASSGVQTITVKVFDGLVLLNESSTSVVLT